MAVSILLIFSALVSGSLTGFVAGVAWSIARLPSMSVRVAVLLVLVAVAADLLGRPRPVSVNRQVPIEWPRLLGIRVASVLYGARLGVGPMTILSTWLWWASLLIGAATDPISSMAVGATFAAVRIGSVLIASAVVSRDAVVRMSALRRAETAVSRTTLAFCAAGSVWVLFVS